MSRLNNLRKAKTNVEEQKEKPQEPPKTEASAERDKPQKTGSRLSRIAGKAGRASSSGKSGDKKPIIPCEAYIERERAKDEKAARKEITPDTAKVTDEQVPRKSRLASMGVAKRDTAPPRPVPMDEEVAQFQKDLDVLEDMAQSHAPELREGISSVMKRMQTKPHLVEYMYENPEEMTKALRGFRAAFKKRHKETSARATKKASKAAEVSGFLDLADL